jgi:hypothetical protein
MEYSKFQQNQFFSSKISILILVSGALMIGHGARMIYQGIFYPNSYYSPNYFDILFDWTTLLILGIIMFYLGLKIFYVKQRNAIKQ